MDLCLAPSAYIEALTPYVTVLGDMALRRWLRLNEVIKVELFVLIRAQENWYTCKKRTKHQSSFLCKPGKGISLEPHHSGTLISDFQRPELRESKFLLFKPPSQLNFTMGTEHQTLSIYVEEKNMCIICLIHTLVYEQLQSRSYVHWSISST